MEKKASKARGLAWIAVGCGIAAIFAFGIRPLAHAVPFSWEKRLGSAVDASENPTLCASNPAAKRAREKLLKRIFPRMPGDERVQIRVVFVRNRQVNAFATLGGRINVYSGLVEKIETPEALTGVIAHEIAHVTHRHVMAGAISQIFTTAGMQFIFTGNAARLANALLTIDYTREQEAEADDYAFRRLQAAHVDNTGLMRLFEREKTAHSLFAYFEDHPAPEDRIRIGKRYTNSDTTPVLSPAEWTAMKAACRKNPGDDTSDDES